MKIRGLLFIVAMGLCASAKADVYRCGKIGTYSDKPCGKNSHRLSIAAPPEGVPESQMIAHQELDGFFWMNGVLNGKRMKFMVDTGASTVSLPASMSEIAGSEACALRRFSTAGGKARGCVFKAKTLTLGATFLRDVDVALIEGLDRPLLGLNVIRKLGIGHIKGDRMDFGH